MSSLSMRSEYVRVERISQYSRGRSPGKTEPGSKLPVKKTPRQQMPSPDSTVTMGHVKPSECLPGVKIIEASPCLTRAVTSGQTLCPTNSGKNLRNPSSGTQKNDKQKMQEKGPLRPHRSPKRDPDAAKRRITTAGTSTRELVKYFKNLEEIKQGEGQLEPKSPRPRSSSPRQEMTAESRYRQNRPPQRNGIPQRMAQSLSTERHIESARETSPMSKSTDALQDSKKSAPKPGPRPKPFSPKDLWKAREKQAQEAKEKMMFLSKSRESLRTQSKDQNIPKKTNIFGFDSERTLRSFRRSPSPAQNKYATLPRGMFRESSKEKEVKASSQKPSSGPCTTWATIARDSRQSRSQTRKDKITPEKDVGSDRSSSAPEPRMLGEKPSTLGWLELTRRLVEQNRSPGHQGSILGQRQGKSPSRSLNLPPSGRSKVDASESNTNIPDNEPQYSSVVNNNRTLKLRYMRKSDPTSREQVHIANESHLAWRLARDPQKTNKVGMAQSKAKSAWLSLAQRVVHSEDVSAKEEDAGTVWLAREISKLRAREKWFYQTEPDQDKEETKTVENNPQETGITKFGSKDPHLEGDKTSFVSTATFTIGPRGSQNKLTVSRKSRSRESSPSQVSQISQHSTVLTVPGERNASSSRIHPEGREKSPGRGWAGLYSPGKKETSGEPVVLTGFSRRDSRDNTLERKERDKSPWRRMNKKRDASPRPPDTPKSGQKVFLSVFGRKQSLPDMRKDDQLTKLFLSKFRRKDQDGKAPPTPSLQRSHMSTHHGEPTVLSDEETKNVKKKTLFSLAGASKLSAGLSKWKKKAMKKGPDEEAIEKFSANTSHIGETLRDLCQRLQETEFPNTVEATEVLITDHEAEMREVREDLSNTIKHGEILLACFRTVRGDDGNEVVLPSSQLPSNKLNHITAVERLLVQLEETQRNFDEFWSHHASRLQQCLELRRFEEEFKQLQFSVERHLGMLQTMNDPGDSLQRVETLLRELSDFEEESREDFSKASQLQAQGEQLIADDHYAVDCIRPKCIELQRMCEQYKELVRRRYEMLQKSRDLQDRIDKANKWCTRGLDLLAAQQLEHSAPECAAQALEDIEAFQASAAELRLNNPKEFRSLFDGLINTETKSALTVIDSLNSTVVEEVEVVVQQVLQRVEDVQNMCDKRRGSLKKLVILNNRPIQTVVPEQVTATPTQNNDSDRKRKKSLSGNGMRKNNAIERMGKGKIEIIKTDGSGSDTSGSIECDLDIHHNNVTRATAPTILNSPSLLTADTLQAKRGHVMKELIDTERVYVSELKSILEGYAQELDNPAMQHLIPAQLLSKRDILFGNMEELYDFHNRLFLKDLENCQNTPGMVGKCFVDRKEEFQMYSTYCQNKPDSEALRREVGDNNPFFKECQKKLNHRLPLGAYLLKPVQRITKYQLLLKEMLKYTQNEEGNEALQEAVDTMLSVLKYVNDIMHQVAITGYTGSLSSLGRLLMQGSFNVWTAHKKDKIRDLRFKPMQRHIFLYMNAILFCKKKDDLHNAENASYLFKNSVETSRIGLTETVKGDKKKFEVWLHGRQEVYIIQAPNLDVKATWVTEIKKVLMNQFDKIKENVKKSKDIPASAIPTSRTYDNMYTSLPTSTSTENTANNNPSLPSSLDIISPTEATTSLTRDYETSEDGDWSSEEFDDENITMETALLDETMGLDLLTQYIALADYNAVGPGEISMREGDIVEVIKVGREGWWYVRCMATCEEGWAPASYLDSCKRRSTYSTTSMSSAGKSLEGEESEV